jgi:orotate phosphoribosyltransferase
MIFLPDRGLPFRSEHFIIQGSEANAPALKDNHFDFLLSVAVDGLPLAFGYAIALSRISGLVILRDSGRKTGTEGLEDFFG